MPKGRPFDHDYVEEVIERLRGLPLDRKPAWGSMTAAEMISHLANTIRFSMGRGPALPDQSSWFSRNVVRRLLLGGYIKIPKNLKVPRPEGAEPPPEADLETLHAILEDYLNRVQDGGITLRAHPFLGYIGIDGWARLHYFHFEHHLEQFGV